MWERDWEPERDRVREWEKERTIVRLWARPEHNFLSFVLQPCFPGKVSPVSVAAERTPGELAHQLLFDSVSTPREDQDYKYVLSHPASKTKQRNKQTKTWLPGLKLTNLMELVEQAVFPRVLPAFFPISVSFLGQVFGSCLSDYWFSYNWAGRTPYKMCVLT